MSLPSNPDLAPVTALNRAVIVINTKARRGKEWPPRIRESLKQNNLELLGFYECDTSAESIARLEKAVAEQVPLIVVGGGDGTLSTAAQKVVGGKSVLGVLPLGTGNAFARDLGIPSNPEQACQILSEGKVANVDLGLIGDKFFVNVATVGLTTRIAEGLTGDAKRRLGRMAYAFAIFRAVLTTKSFIARLTTDKGTAEYKTLQFVVGSGRFHAGPFPVAPDARITDGRLHGYVLAPHGRGALLRYALHLWGGRQGQLPEVHTFTTAAGRLETTPHIKVDVDGELRQRTPIDFKIAPHVLRVMVPQGFESDVKQAISQG